MSYIKITRLIHANMCIGVIKIKHVRAGIWRGEMWMVSQYGRWKVLGGESEKFVLDEWVVNVDLLANTL